MLKTWHKECSYKKIKIIKTRSQIPITSNKIHQRNGKSTIKKIMSFLALTVTVVELGGKARSPDEKDLATKLVSDVYGVKSVVNTMIVQ